MFSEGCLWERVLPGTWNVEMCVFAGVPSGEDLAGGIWKKDLYISNGWLRWAPIFGSQFGLRLLGAGDCTGALSRRSHPRTARRVQASAHVFSERYVLSDGQKPEPAERCSGSLGARQAIAVMIDRPCKRQRVPQHA